MKIVFARFVLVFIAIQITACGSGVELTAEEHVKRAEAYMDQAEMRAGIIELKNALRKDPDNPRARWLLGKINLDIGNAATAEKELIRARELGVVDDAVLPLLVRAWLALGKLDEVTSLAVGPPLSDASQADILAAQGEALVDSENLDEAAERFSRALAIYPGSVPALTGRARLEMTRREFSTARDTLEAALELNDSYAKAWALLGDIERAEGRLGEAEAAYSKVIEGSLNHEVELWKRALVRIKLENYDEAKNDIDRLKKQAPDGINGHYAQGMLDFQQKSYLEARDAFLKVLAGDEDYLAAVFYLGASEYFLGNREQADHYLTRFVVSAPGSAPARRLLGIIKLQNGDWAEAERLVRPMVAVLDEDVLSMNVLATALMKQGETDEAVSLLEKVVALQPDSATAKFRLGSGMLASGQQEIGIEYLETALELEPQLQQADITLTLLYFRQKDYDKALAAAEAYRDRHPDLPEPYNLIGVVHMARNHTEEAEQAFRKVLKLVPGDVAGNHNLAAIAVRKRDLTAARKYYEQVLKYHENHLPTLLKLVTLEALDDNEQAQVSRLTEAVATHPEALKPKLLLARYQLAKGRPEQVAVVMGDAREKHPDNPFVLAVIGEAQLAQNQGDDAKVTFKRMVELQPKSAQAHFLFARALAMTKDMTGLERELINTLELNPQHFPARLGLTRLQLLQGDNDAAKINLSLLREQAPDNPDVLFLEAGFAREAGDQDQALGIYESLFEKASNSTVMLSLVQQKWSMGDEEGALVVQERWLDEHPDDITARLALANTYIALDRLDDAIEQYRRIQEQSEKNLVALNNLAWFLRDSNSKKALGYAEKAYELAPESAAIMDTLAIVLMKNGYSDRALRMNERALEKIPGKPGFLYHKAVILEASGRISEAKTILLTLLSDPEEFSGRAEAEQLLARLN
jgi:putative PEP-CTERM system TPR-repeat lipoprotein